jgi:catechol 2,3-dioxygenase-like lactoylglutathione lyase family enzyme
MPATALVCATLPTTDLERAKRYYEETVGLTGSRLGLEGGLFYEAAGGTMLHIYESSAAVPEHIGAVFLVASLDETMAGLRSRGVSFEEYDALHMKTDENGVFTDPAGFRGACFKDPDGNVVALRSY